MLTEQERARLEQRIEELELRLKETEAVLSKAMAAIDLCCERSRTVAEEKACIQAKRAVTELLASVWESGK